MTNNINEKLGKLLSLDGKATPEARAALKAIKKYIKTNPEQAAVIAALGGVSIGLLLGQLLRRK